MTDLSPTPADKCTFGLGPGGWQARGPVGHARRAPTDPVGPVPHPAGVAPTGGPVGGHLCF